MNVVLKGLWLFNSVKYHLSINQVSPGCSQAYYIQYTYTYI